VLSFKEVHTNTTDPPLEMPTGTPGLYQPPVYVADVPADSGSGGGTVPTAPTPTSQVLFYQADCDVSAQPGQPVTAGNAGSVVVADSGSPEAVVGIITRKRSDAVAVVQTAGQVVLGLSGLSPGVDYFLGPAGTLVPPPLDAVQFVQRVGTATSATSLYISLSGVTVRRDI
jgi:hypothetical protein